MPFMDGTGPLGSGPGPGQGRGGCTVTRIRSGCGMRGRRWKAGQAPNAAPEQEASFLERQFQRIKRRLPGYCGKQLGR
jgi:hypothetical protein